MRRICLSNYPKIIFTVFCLWLISACTSGGNPYLGDMSEGGSSVLRHKSGINFGQYVVGQSYPGTKTPEQNIDDPTSEGTPLPPSTAHALVTGQIKAKPFAGGEFLLATYTKDNLVPISTKKISQLGYFSMVVPKSIAELTIKATYTKPDGTQKVQNKNLGKVEENIQDVKFDFSENKKPAQDYVLPADIVEGI